MTNSEENSRHHPRQPFKQDEDEMLIELVQSYQHSAINWKDISFKMKNRNIRQCKERWEKYLNPNLCIDPWTQEEDDIIINMHSEFGPKWTLMANILENRTDIMIKNRWNVLHRKAIKFSKNKKNDYQAEDNEKEIRYRKRKNPKMKKKQKENNDKKVNKNNEKIENKNNEKVENKNSDDLLSQSMERFNIFDQIFRMNDFYDFDVYL